MMKDIDSSHAIQTTCITSGIPCPLKTSPSLHFYPLPPKVASHIFSSSLQCLHVDGRPGKTASKRGKQRDVASKRLCQTLGLNSHVAVLLHPCLGRALLMAKLLHKSLQLTNLTIHIPNIPTLTLFPVLLTNLRCPTQHFKAMTSAEIITPRSRICGDSSQGRFNPARLIRLIAVGNMLKRHELINTQHAQHASICRKKNAAMTRTFN